MQLIKRISDFEKDLETKLQCLPDKRKDAYKARRVGAMELPGSERSTDIPH